MPEFALGAHLKVVSRFDTELNQRHLNDKTPRYLVLVCHGFFITNQRNNQQATGMVNPPNGIKMRFSVNHGETSSLEDLLRNLRELTKYGKGAVNRMYPDKVNGPTTNYHLGKGEPESDKTVANVNNWFLSSKQTKEQQKNEPSASWAGKPHLKQIFNAVTNSRWEATVFDLARVTQTCHRLGDVFRSMSAPHAYTHLLLNFCREGIALDDVINYT